MSNRGKWTNFGKITFAVNQHLGTLVWKETVRRIMKKNLRKASRGFQ